MQQTSQNAFLFYLHMFLSLLIALAVRVIAFAPLAALVVDRLPSWLALLCPVLFLFVVMPLRFSAASVSRDPMNGSVRTPVNPCSIVNFGVGWVISDFKEKHAMDPL